MTEMRMIGILDSASPESRGEELSAFYRGLREAGVDPSSIIISYVWANNDYDGALPKVAKELVKRNPAVIVAAGGPASAIEAQKAAPSRMPIVFTTIANPISSGLVVDLNRPGKNATGTFGYTTELEPHRMRVLNDLTKKLGAIGVLINPNRPYPKEPNPYLQREEREADARSVGREAVIEEASTPDEIDQAFTQFRRYVQDEQVAALLVTADPFFSSRRHQIVLRANALKIPAIYQWPSFVEASGLMSYGPNKVEGYSNAADFIRQILIENKLPRDLPVKSTKNFELVISKSRAEALDITIPSQWEGRPVRVLP